MSELAQNSPILEVKQIVKDFPVGGVFQNQQMRALNDVSFQLNEGKALAVVGESGSGKSTCARILSRLYQPNEGQIYFKGTDVTTQTDRRNLLDYRQYVQMIFQDPFGSLNPSHTIEYHLKRPLLIHNKVKGKKEIQERIHSLLNTVGLTPVKETAKKYPHQISGGQRQRVAIARALAVEAKVILADEPTSMLDVSIRIGVLNLLEEMKSDLGIAFLYITHDIATARYFAEDTAVMYVGHMVEWGDTEEVTQSPQHPYTRLLISTVPGERGGFELETDKGEKAEIPLWTPTSKGCPFVSRCPQVQSRCQGEMPPVKEISNKHFVRCFLYE